MQVVHNHPAVTEWRGRFGHERMQQLFRHLTQLILRLLHVFFAIPQGGGEVSPGIQLRYEGAPVTR